MRAYYLILLILFSSRPFAFGQELIVSDAYTEAGALKKSWSAWGEGEVDFDGHVGAKAAGSVRIFQENFQETNFYRRFTNIRPSFVRVSFSLKAERLGKSATGEGLVLLQRTGADEAGQRAVQQAAGAQHQMRAPAMAEDLVVALAAIRRIVLPGDNQGAQPIHHPRQPAVGRHQQRGGGGQEERGGQHRGQDGVVAEGGGGGLEHAASRWRAGMMP